MISMYFWNVPLSVLGRTKREFGLENGNKHGHIESRD